MKVSVHIMTTDDHGKLIGLYQGRRFQMKDEPILAITESLEDAILKSPFSESTTPRTRE
jgi:hypothetical protein